VPIKHAISPLPVAKGKLKRWRVITPVDLRSHGLPHRRFFARRDDALAYAAALIELRRGAKTKLLALTDAEQIRLLNCIKAVDGDVSKLESAVDFFVRMRPKAGTTMPLSKIIDECVFSKETANLRTRYISSFRSALGLFAKQFTDTRIADIRPDQIESWLNGNGYAPATRRGYLSYLRAFFAYAVRREYCPENPAVKVEMPRLDDRPPGILTPDECACLLRTCGEIHPQALPQVYLCLFAGLRPNEARLLSWSDVGEHWIEIKSHKAKSRRRRLVTINPTLSAWIKLRGDLPFEGCYSRVMNQIRKAARPQVNWSHDCLRHSFASYHLAAHQSPDKTAHEMGHRDTDLLFAHYRELVRPEDAARFWALMPHQG
jgi:integrase